MNSPKTSFKDNPPKKSSKDIFQKLFKNHSEKKPTEIEPPKKVKKSLKNEKVSFSTETQKKSTNVG